MTQAAVITIPNSALVPSTQLYTDVIGGGIGNALVMTGGGSATNVGQSRNDDGFSGPINFDFNFTLFGTTYTTVLGEQQRQHQLRQTASQPSRRPGCKGRPRR